ncbi:MAG: hypothetical protein NTZ05_06135, partial [Chloroflexi bacterium]|nr:hypothetical protein [Chloroflexota bacterium]
GGKGPGDRGPSPFPRRVGRLHIQPSIAHEVSMPLHIPVTDLPDLPEMPVFEWQWPQVALFEEPRNPDDWIPAMEHTPEGRLAFTLDFLDLMAGAGWGGHQHFVCVLVGQSLGGADPGWYEHILDYWGGWQGEPQLDGFPDEMDVAPQAAEAFLRANYWKLAEQGVTEAGDARQALRDHFAHLWLPRTMLARFHDRLVLDAMHGLEEAALERAPDGSLVFRRGPEYAPSGYQVHLVQTGLPAEAAIAALEAEGGLIPEALHHNSLVASLWLPEAAQGLAERRAAWQVLRYEP